MTTSMRRVTSRIRPPNVRPIERVGIVVGLVVATAVVVLAPGRGPVAFAITPRHGVHGFDLVMVPVLLYVARVLRAQSTVATRPSRYAAILPAGIGALLISLGSLALVQPGGEADLADIVAGVAVVGIVAMAVSERSRGRVLTAACGPFVEPTVALALLAGTVLDLAQGPTGTAIGATCACVVLAIEAESSHARRLLLSTAFGTAALNVASLFDIAGVDVVMARTVGAGARTVAVGLVLVVATIGRIPGRDESL
jgi:hypothetical protein